MSLNTLDRHRWSLKEAVAHVREAIDGDDAELAREQAARRTNSPFVQYQERERMRMIYAQHELMAALISRDLCAEGRRSTTRADGRFARRGWIFHSSDYTSINPADWLEGHFGGESLEVQEGEFVDIRLPRFMVLAIWPIPVVRSPPADGGFYTTPYLDLMQAAIAHFGLTADRQDKKENINDWLLTKSIEGEAISKNLADAMATLVRMPSSQRGGAKRG